MWLSLGTVPCLLTAARPLGSHRGVKWLCGHREIQESEPGRVTTWWWGLGALVPMGALGSAGHSSSVGVAPGDSLEASFTAAA